MLARLQQFITLGLFSVAIAWAAWCLNRGEPVWAWAGAALIVLGYAVFLAIELVLVWFVYGNDPAPKATVPQIRTRTKNNAQTTLQPNGRTFQVASRGPGSRSCPRTVGHSRLSPRQALSAQHSLTTSQPC